MPSLLEILKDPNYINANPATKEAIFNKYAPQDENFTGANEATQSAIRQRFGLGAPIVAEKEVPEKTAVIPTAKAAPAAEGPVPPPADEGFFGRNWRYAKEAFTSGLESMQAGTKGEAMAIDAERINQIEEKYGRGAVNAPPDVKERYAEAVKNYLQAKGEREEILRKTQERQQVSPLRPETARLKAAMDKDVGFMESASEAWEALKSNPPGVIADLGIESLPASLYMVTSAAIARLGLKTPMAAPVAGGMASMSNEFGNEYVQRIEAGESHDEAWKNASIKSGVIGVFDAASLGSAGKAAGAIIDAITKKGAVKLAAKEVGKETLKQAGYGAAGEAVGSLAVGEIPNPAAVMAEAVGEVFGAPLEATAAYRKYVPSDAQKKLEDLKSAIATIEDQFNAGVISNTEREQQIRETAAEDFKKIYGREATDDELDTFAEQLERRKMAAGAAGPDATGRIEPSISVSGAPGAEAGVAAEPSDIGAAGVGVPGVSAGVPGAGAQVQPAALKPKKQKKAKAAVIEEVEPKPIAPVTPDAPTIKENPDALWTNNTFEARKELKDGYSDLYFIDADENVTPITSEDQLDQFEETLLTEPSANIWSIPKAEEAPAPEEAAPNIEEQPYMGRGLFGEPERRSLKLENLNEEWGRLNRERQSLSDDKSLTDSMRAKLNAGYQAKMDDVGNQITAERDRLDSLEAPAGGFPKRPPAIAAPAPAPAPAAKKKGKVKAKPAIEGRKVAKMLADSARESPQTQPIESNVDSVDLHKTEETVKAKPDINKRRVSKLLGQKLYGNPENMAPVSVKEMVQNAFDAVKALLPGEKLGSTSAGITEGKIDIKVDKNKRLISVLDNGHGMDTNTLSTTFLTIAGTKKETPRGSGGLGIAKMQFLFNNKAIKVVTMRDGVVSVLDSTGDILDEAMEDPNVAPDVYFYKGSEIPSEYLALFPDGHGTYAEVIVPENYTEEETGEQKSIPLEPYASYYPVLSRSPLFADIEVSFNGIELPIGKNFPYQDYTQFVDVKFNWGTANIYVSKVPKKVYFDNTQILSRGLWQFNAKIGANDKLVQREFIIDVDPNKDVDPTHRAYPFSLNRQNFAPTVEAGFDQIFKYLSIIYSAVDFSTEAQNFGSVQYLTKDAKGNIVESAPRVLEPPKKDTGLAAFAGQVSEADVIEVKDGRLYVKGREIPVITPDNMKGTVIDLDEFKVPQSEVDPNKVILHDNVEVPGEELAKLQEEYANLDSSKFDTFSKYVDYRTELKRKISDYETTGKYTSLVSLARDKFGNRFDSFAYEIGDVFKSLRDLVVEIMGTEYQDLLKEGIGVSFDVEYRGVSIKIPFSGMFINPAVPESADIVKAAYGTAGTMVHELAHYKVRSHNEKFPAEMQRITYELAAANARGDTRIIALLDRLVKLYKSNEDVFNFIRETNRDSNAKARGKRFKDSGSYEARYAGGTRIVEGSRPATGGNTGLFGGSESGNLGLRAEQQRAGVPGETTPINPEDRLLANVKPSILKGAVLEALANNDINGALRAVAAQTRGFYSDLAARLADLNLPTKIVLNNARSLVYKQITEMTRFEQMRLFDYIQRTYPDVYDKYFQNYDREENLTKVFDGLRAIKTGFNLDPVIGEYETVVKEFDKNIDGLVIPGAYYPYFDTITLDTTSATYDIFLHEVLHAATSAIIDADPSTLTPGQLEALTALQEMFDYAKKQIPLNLYGFRNLHEFVSELFTNKNFRERLQKIQYAPAKQPLLTQIARAIYKLFGIDNLAGNAMAQATQLFSAVRTRQPVSIGPLFAPKQIKRDPKKGPVTGNWRADDDYETTWTSEMGRIIKNAPNWQSAIKKVYKALSDVNAGDLRKLVLPNLGLRHLSDLTRMAFPQLMGAVRIVEQMLAYRNRHLTKAGDILRDGFELQRKSPNMMKLLGRVVIESTIRGIHPEKGMAAFNRNPSDPKALDPNDPLARAWSLLPYDFKNIANRMMKYYSDNLDETVQIMIDRINATAKTPSEKARLIADVQKEFGSGARIDPYFPLYRFGNYWFQVGKGAFKEFVKFESKFARNRAMRRRAEELTAKNRKDLADSIRMGNNISDLYTQGLATTEVFQRIESLVDNITASNIQDAKDEMKDSLNQLLYVMLPQQSMRKMFINRNAIQGASADILRVFAHTAMHSAYQMSRFKYSDAFRTNLLNARDYVDKKYSGGKYAPLGAVYKDYISEVESRIPQIMSNEDYSVWMSISAKASQAAYYYMLLAPATVLANLFGFPQLVMSTLGGDYGYVKVYRKSMGYMRLYGQSTGQRTLVPLGKRQVLQVKYPSLFESNYLTGLQRQAADTFLLERDIDVSQTNDILSLGDKPSEFYTKTPERIRQFVSGPMHQSERLMREVGLLTAFDLAYEKFSKDPKRAAEGYILRDPAGNPIMRTQQEIFEDAIQEARDKIGISLGDFNRQMKPRTMATPGLSILMIFKTFPIYASYNIIRDAQVYALGPLSKLEREHIRDSLEDLLKNDPNKNALIEQRMNEINEYLRVARMDNKRRLAGIFGTAMIIGGWAATPLFSVITPLLIKMLSSDDDDDEFFDWEAWFHNWSVNTAGGYAASVLENMGANKENAKKYGKMIGQSVERGPISAMTGASLTDRVSLDLKNLWFRDPRYSPDLREEITETAIANAGPAVGLAVNHIDGYSLFQQGYYQRAIEKILPTVAKNPLVATRYAKEGATTKKGELLAADFSAWELALQAIGLQPERLAIRQKEAIRRKTYEQKVKDEKTAIMNRLWLEKDNPDGYERALQRMDKFNSKHPNFAIKPESIVESFVERGKNQAEAEQYGTFIDRKLRMEVDDKFGMPSSPKPD